LLNVDAFATFYKQIFNSFSNIHPKLTSTLVKAKSRIYELITC